MAKINSHFSKLCSNYLFPEIQKRVASFKEAADPSLSFLNLGIGDVSKPIAPPIAEAIAVAAEKMSQKESIRGYGPENGYAFLRQAIFEDTYSNLDLSADEIFISDGSKCDTANILDIFSQDNVVAIADPSYPVYVDSTVMSGRSGHANQQGQYEGIVYLPCTKESNFLALPPSRHCDLIYLCSPNNPTGTAFSRKQLESWVSYAHEHQAIIFFDTAYRSFITDQTLPKSIFEIPGAHEVAIEFHSFSKSAGFTGLRCAYTVISKRLMALDSQKKQSIWKLWKRRQSSKFGGLSYITQCAAKASLSKKARQYIKEDIQNYMQGCQRLKKALEDLNYTCYGGINAPYLWCETPQDMSSWDFFDLLLQRVQLITVPGRGFGPAGEGYVRLSAFATEKTIDEAISRLMQLHVVSPSICC